MGLSNEKHSARENRLLAALPREEYKHLTPHLELVRLAQGKIIYHTDDLVRYAYFLRGGMVTLLSTTGGGRSIEVGIIGDEGVVGLPDILGVNRSPYQIMVQLPTSALRVRGDVLKSEFTRGGFLQDLLLRYLHALIAQIAQSAACNRFHGAEARLCRWLLLTQDRVRADTLHLTQEFLSNMLGIPRTSVTMLAGDLQKRDIIKYSRGKITVLNRRYLEAASCECYKFPGKNSAVLLPLETT